MLEQFTGVKALLWERAPAMALVLLSSALSGCPAIVRCRDSVLTRIPMPNEPSFGSVALPSLSHVSSAFHSFPLPFLYIEFGHSDIHCRPSRWANPFYFLEDDGCVSLALYRRYLLSRADLVPFLAPLNGATMICDCGLGEYCHGHTLTQVFSEYCASLDTDDRDAAKVDAMSVACVIDGV